MKERGILFTKENRLASVEGRKTQTRRVCKNNRNSHVDIQQGEWVKFGSGAMGGYEFATFKRELDKKHPKYGQQLACNSIAIDSVIAPYQVGDKLYMLEPYQIDEDESNFLICNIAGKYLDDNQRFELFNEDIPKKLCNRKKPYMKTSSRFMYKSLARYWFEVTQVRVERVQDITPEDCEYEGVNGVSLGSPVRGQPYEIYTINNGLNYGTPIEAFEALWDEINLKRGYGWDVNPFVWVYDFKRIEVNK